MNMHLLDQVRELSIDERIQLVEAIWDSLAEGAAAPLTKAQKAELERRLADHRANPDDVVPWNEVKATVLAHIEAQKGQI